MRSEEALYDEVLETLLDSSKDPQDEDNNCFMFNFRQIIKIEKAIMKAQKQEKLLELYKELITVKDDLFSYCEIVDDGFYDIRKIETYLEKQIRENENE